MIAGLLFSQLLLQRCGAARAEMLPAEYVQWVEDEQNGLKAAKTIGDYTFELQYKPDEYVVLRENSVAMPSAQEMRSETASIADMQYFTFRISSDSGNDLLNDEPESASEYSSRLVYFSSLMQQDISLVENGDTLPCMLFHFERTFGVDTRSTFLLGFPKSKDMSTEKTFIYDDQELRTGTIILNIAGESIQNIPSLKLD
jgi:hypothetical protein